MMQSLSNPEDPTALVYEGLARRKARQAEAVEQARQALAQRRHACQQSWAPHVGRVLEAVPEKARPWLVDADEEYTPFDSHSRRPAINRRLFRVGEAGGVWVTLREDDDGETISYQPELYGPVYSADPDAPTWERVEYDWEAYAESVPTFVEALAESSENLAATLERQKAEQPEHLVRPTDAQIWMDRAGRQYEAGDYDAATATAQIAGALALAEELHLIREALEVPHL